MVGTLSLRKSSGDIIVAKTSSSNFSNASKDDNPINSSVSGIRKGNLDGVVRSFVFVVEEDVFFDD